MKTIDDLWISPWPWTCEAGGSPIDRDGDFLDPNEADARLIASAPELYDALYRIVSAADDSVFDFAKWRENLHAALHDARKALAKASGEGVEI